MTDNKIPTARESLDALVCWIVEALEFNPMPRNAAYALDILVKMVTAMNKEEEEKMAETEITIGQEPEYKEVVENG